VDKIRVIISDDHPIFRIGLANVIRASERLDLIGEAENGEQALKLISELNPDVAVLDIEMPFRNGLQVCEEVCANQNNRTKIIILTLYKEFDLYQKAMEIGASGYLLKDNAVGELVRAIENVFAGSQYISQSLDQLLVSKNSHLMENPKLMASLSKLTQTEKKILHLISEHKTTKDIASMLFVSDKTIENHRYNISKKLELEGGQNNLLMFAMENKVFLE